jgi:hypothetical protein
MKSKNKPHKRAANPLRKCISWLLDASQNTRRNLIMLLGGFGITLAGLLMVMLAEFMLRQSFQQELLAAFGSGLIAIGLITATTGYICLSILGLIRYIFLKPRETKESTAGISSASPSAPLDKKLPTDTKH